MVMIMALPTAEAAAQTKKFVKDAGGNGTWDRLAEYLAEVKDQHEIFVMNRSFEASAAQIYDAWTKPERFAEWIGLEGMVQRKLEKPKYLEYTQTFREKDGQQFLTRVFLVPEEAEGTTRVTLILEPFGKVSTEERKAFATMKSGLAQSWTKAFDTLEAHLSA
jgi:uncharacterized protein YndB with AHSA1/START domain